MAIIQLAKRDLNSHSPRISLQKFCDSCTQVGINCLREERKVNILMISKLQPGFPGFLVHLSQNLRSKINNSRNNLPRRLFLH